MWLGELIKMSRVPRECQAHNTGHVGVICYWFKGYSGRRGKSGLMVYGRKRGPLSPDFPPLSPPDALPVGEETAWGAGRDKLLLPLGSQGKCRLALSSFPFLRCGPSKGHNGVEPDPELWAPAPSSPWRAAPGDGAEWGDGAQVRPSHRPAAPRHREAHRIQDVPAGVGGPAGDLGRCQSVPPQLRGRRVQWGVAR